MKYHEFIKLTSGIILGLSMALAGAVFGASRGEITIIYLIVFIWMTS